MARIIGERSTVRLIQGTLGESQVEQARVRAASEIAHPVDTGKAATTAAAPVSTAGVTAARVFSPGTNNAGTAAVPDQRTQGSAGSGGDTTRQPSGRPLNQTA